MNKQEIEKLLEEIECEPYSFSIREKDNNMFLIGSYFEKDVLTGLEEEQKTRKWYISQYATKSEIVQTVLKCVLTSMEHRAREAFKYRGKRVFGPHFDVDALHNICTDKMFDYRPAHLQDGVEA